MVRFEKTRHCATTAYRAGEISIDSRTGHGASYEDARAGTGVELEVGVTLAGNQRGAVAENGASFDQSLP